MKNIRIIMVFMLMAILVAGCSQEADMTAPATQTGYDKDGTEALGPPSVALADGSNFAEGGVGMGFTDTGNFDVTVPGGATVVQAFLYWTGGTTGADGDDTISVNGNPVTGTLIGGPTNFFENYNFYAYRADITSEGWVVPGVNSFEITDFDFDFSGSTLDENHGASILVVYDDGSEAELALFDGLDCAYFNFASPLDATVPQTFTFAAEGADRVADMIVFSGSVGENRPNQIKVTTSAGDQIFDNPLFGAEGPQWDSLTLQVDVPAGATELTVELISVVSTDPRGASMTWIGTGLAVPVTPPEYFCIGDFVWYDTDCNGCQDDGERGVRGVKVFLYEGCPAGDEIGTT
ncbi:MAG: SdrD B-like domain-containing protein, partial [Candidatus Krumholzibacteriota bacterium]